MTALVRGNALALPLTDGSVDLIVTSPPYFGLRSYTDNGQHYAGQIGSEATPGEFLDALIAATAEMVRVLKPSGSIFVNLGDKYSGNGRSGAPSSSSTLRGNGHVGGGPKKQTGAGRVPAFRPTLQTDVPTKSLMGLPWRYAIRAVDELGLILRAEIIWSKPNGLPESVTDRVRRSHEQWFHFTREPRYYSSVDAIREGYQPSTDVSRGVLRDSRPAGHEPNPLGKLPGSVWSVPTQPLTVPTDLGVDHFAAFPMEWPRRIIQGWSPNGICTGCGEGLRPIVTRATANRHNNGRHGPTGLTPDNNHGKGASTLDIVPDYRITGESCSCPDAHAPTRPAIVLDPFGGTGTVAMVADALGRHGISVDMSGDYCRLARWRTSDPGERAKAAQVARPPAEPVDMDALW